MSNVERVFFRRTGAESSAFALVRLFENNGKIEAEASIDGPFTERSDYDDLPASGDPQTVLKEASEMAALKGLDVRVDLDGVEWPDTLGSLVG